MALGRVLAWKLAWDFGRPLRVHRLFQPLPTQLRLAASEAERLGLKVMVERKLTLEGAEMALAQVLAIDDSHRFVVEIVGGFPADAPSPLWEIKSVLSDGMAVLVTSQRHRMPVAAAVVLQTFPLASPDQLLAAHRHGLVVVESLGATVVPVHSASEVSSLAHQLAGQPARDDRRRTARTLRENTRNDHDEGLEPLSSRVELPQQLARLRGVGQQ